MQIPIPKIKYGIHTELIALPKKINGLTISLTVLGKAANFDRTIRTAETLISGIFLSNL